ncbi:hypothetical protein [Arenicella xantha]|uniref:NlpE-like protein n=1 Tax=Arenicella xantha TaxID=644221 RepID=A0A395JJQ5_9GAMM|nr:hypothetical protein [Arenicella xantha]RBP50749.1 hypothetical protein DFR28_102161 [Arenicella xantha]
MNRQKLKKLIAVTLFCAAATASADEALSTLSFNVDNRHGKDDITLFQCSSLDCSGQSKELLANIAHGQLGDGWPVTTRHPTQQAVLKLLLQNKTDQRTCSVTLGQHGPFMLITPRFDDHEVNCDVSHITN